MSCNALWSSVRKGKQHASFVLIVFELDISDRSRGRITKKVYAVKSIDLYKVCSHGMETGRRAEKIIPRANDTHRHLYQQHA